MQQKHGIVHTWRIESCCHFYFNSNWFTWIGEDLLYFITPETIIDAENICILCSGYLIADNDYITYIIKAQPYTIYYISSPDKCQF